MSSASPSMDPVYHRILIEEGSNNDGVATKHEYERLRQRKWAVYLLSSCTVLLFADQNLMSPNLSAIANDFGFNDEERDRKLGGDIALAFWVLGAPASFVIGCLADHYDRTQLFACTVFIGEGACLATFWTSTYAQLYVCRAITGLSIGGALPLIYSVLGDMFAAEDRHAVSSYVGIGCGIGISLGQGIAGFLGPVAGWRTPFLVVSIPALVIALAFRLMVKDPERGGMERAVLDLRIKQRMSEIEVCVAGCASVHQEEDIEMVEIVPVESTDAEPCNSMRSISEVELSGDMHAGRCLDQIQVIKSLLSTPTLLLSLLQGAPGCIPWGIVNTYLNDFLASDRGMSVEFATVVVLVFGLGNFFGMILGGQGGKYLYSIDTRYPALLAGLMAIFGCFPFWFLLNKIDSRSSLWELGPVSLLSGLASGVTGPIIKATLQNVTLPQMRGIAFSIFNTFDDFGRGLGPVFVAMLISRFGSRTPAFNIGVTGWLLCGIFNLCIFFTVEKDEENVQDILRDNLSLAMMHGRGAERPTANRQYSDDDDAPLDELIRPDEMNRT